MRILAIDPSAERDISATGYAVIDYTAQAPVKVVASGAIYGGYEGFIHSVGRLQTYKPDKVVCEHYIAYNKAADPTPLLVEGVVRFLWPDTVLQPSTGKNTLVPDHKLKEWGHWDSKAGHHADEREAIRHAYVYLVNERHTPTLKALSE